MNRIVAACLAICVLAVLVYMFYGKVGPGSDSNDIMGAIPDDIPRAIGICKQNTPFVYQEETYYAKSCLLFVACKVKPVSYKDAVTTCKVIEEVPYVDGDQNITGEQCIAYLESC